MTLFAGVVLGQGPRAQRLNPIIELLQQKKPVFGLYAEQPAWWTRWRGAGC